MTTALAPSLLQARPLRLARREIARFSLELHGLALLTEAASGPYAVTPVLAAMAGATRVFAVTRDSVWATADEVEETTNELAAAAGVADRVTVVRRVDDDVAGAVDIVTNSGFVRPIDEALVRRLRPTAVVPLMFEPWEHRAADVDLGACAAHGIAVAGTDEHDGLCDLRSFSAVLGVRLLLTLGVEVAGSRIVVLGAQPTLGRPIAAALRALGADVAAFAAPDEASADSGIRPYTSLAPEDLREVDGVVVADHRDRRCLVGRDGLVDPAALAALAPDAVLALVSGGVDGPAVRDSGVRHAPAWDRLAAPGSMHASPAILGPLPVLRLYAAGVAVGAALARARLAGLPVDAAIRSAMTTSPALPMDQVPPCR